MDRGRLSILACDAGRPFAERVVAALRGTMREVAMGNGADESEAADETANLRIRESEETWFANGEVKTQIQENIRGDDVYIFQSHYSPSTGRSVNDNLMALLTAVNAARQSDAESVTVVSPLYPYSRQERRRGREGITAAQVAQFMETSGAVRVLTLDVHAEAIAGAFRTAKFENLHASRVIVDHVKKNYPIDNLVVISPDAGGAHRARHYAKMLSTEFALIEKVRDYRRPGTVVGMRLVGTVEGRDALVVDDMVDTGGTLIKALQTLKDKGAKDIHVCCTHPLLSKDAVDRLDKAYQDGVVKQVLATDSVMWGDILADRPWYHEVSVAHLFAAVIRHINRKQSVSELLS